MIVLDAGVVIAFFSPHDAHHARAKNLLVAEPGPFLMHPLTVAETLVGPAKAGREAAMWRALRKLGVEVVEMDNDEPVLLAQLRATHGMKMPDTCVLATAVHHNAQLATFDDKLGKVAEKLSLRYIVPELP